MKQEHYIPSKDDNLRVTVFKPKNISKKLPLIILGAGWGNSLENNYEFASEVSDGVPAIVVVFDYAGIGNSSGNVEHFSRKDHLDNFVAIYDWAVRFDGVDTERVGINGGSYSGYMAALLTAHRPVKSLLLRAPALYPDSTFDIQNDTDAPRPDNYYEKIVNEDSAKMLKSALQEFKNPILVQEREGDKEITNLVISYYLNNNKSETKVHTVLKGAGHKISGKLKNISTQECIDWFKKTLISSDIQ